MANVIAQHFPQLAQNRRVLPPKLQLLNLAGSKKQCSAKDGILTFQISHKDLIGREAPQL